MTKHTTTIMMHSEVGDVVAAEGRVMMQCIEWWADMRAGCFIMNMLSGEFWHFSRKQMDASQAGQCRPLHEVAILHHWCDK